MENASKALIMAATVLLGVMIISVGVTLFKTFSDFSSDTAQKMQEKQISEWNNTYLKYYGTNITSKINSKGQLVEEQGPIKVTAHDIVSVINSAAQNNIYYFEDETDKTKYAGNENYYYVQVSIAGLTKGNNAENWDEEQKMQFLKQNSLTDKNETMYFKCTDVKISSVTKRVYSITFSKIK